jgi:hypothetical protein
MNPERTMSEQLNITPETKINQLLKAYPELEKVLIGMSPAFSKLRNPVLRNTVAKVATLRQVAQVGNVSLPNLINRLREQVGLETETWSEIKPTDQAQPSWFDPGKIKRAKDIRPILNRGEQPLNEVLTDLKSLQELEIYKLIAPFPPAPLIDKAKRMGVDVWAEQIKPDLFHVYFKKSRVL